MKTTHRILTPAVVAVCLALPLWADDQKDPAKYPAGTSPDSSTYPGQPHRHPAEAFGIVTKAKGVMGIEVQNLQNEKLGKVEDIAMSFSSGRVVAVVVSVGGVLGIGDTLVAVPPSEFSYDAGSKALHLNRTKDELKNAPKLDLAKWDEFQQPANLAEIYRYYGVKTYPHAETDGTTVVHPDHGPSVFQQGNSDGDLGVTSHIRRELLRRSDLSANAHNVTVITLNGRVTLRGTVNSEDEKRIVGEVAQNAAAPGNVDNLIEVSSAANK